MPRVARVLWPLVAITAVAVCLEVWRRMSDEQLARADARLDDTDDTLDQSFPASDPPSWSSAAAAPAKRSTRDGAARPSRGESPDV